MDPIATAEFGLRLAGAGQVAMGLAHPIAVRSMGWREELKQVGKLNARIFRGLFAYISALNVAFGALALLGAGLLLDGSTLAKLVSAGIASYWGVRLLLQCFYYPWHLAPGYLGSVLVRAMLLFAFASFSFSFAFAVAVS